MYTINNHLHRKTSSNIKNNEVQKYNYPKQHQKHSNTQLMQKLEGLQVLKKLVTGPSKSLNHNNSKTRIRTEGNEKQFKVQMSISPKKEKEKEKSASPPQRNSHSQVNVISNLINQNLNHTEYKRLTREQRNQSVDFQALLSQQQQRNENGNLKNSTKKKFNSYGNLNEQVYFSQRSGLSECPSALQLIQNTIDQKLMGLKGSSSMKQFPTPPIIKLQKQQQITTKEFKEKLSNLSRDQRQNKVEIEDELQKTQKKQNNIYITKYDNQKIRNQQKEDLSQRSKSVDSQTSKSLFDNLQNQFECDETQKLNYYQTQANDEYKGNQLTQIKQKKLESKIDQLVVQVQLLKKKSEQLELQNKFLFENLTQFKQETDCNTDERNILLNKLDQMIGMQKMQEENFIFFKQIFVKGQDQSRRIKTEQHQQQIEEENLKINQKIESKQRPFVKSAYQGLDFNI
ncbi:unnamed protein product [Paramecium sonneborni]|uniref:Uncharacterized protein n=1 Tax=Paramecium sonneborni TaxID=65129 RepID=A0A8S1KSY5_9CILI|nr:unnamed protein product [Paramecium sonneborni]